ncbi:MAG: arsenate reductase [Chloroflexi bacterium]|nr:MAG: arsenate reductase [Chloroflexota bacterium]
MLKVLFLCTGNSCRSQMAEAIVNQYCKDYWQAFSAGTAPAGFVHPMAVWVLHEIGITHAGRSKSVEEFYGQTFDQVITVCGNAEQNCPVWLGHGKKVHIGFQDPAKFEGTEDEKMQQFRAVRDEIKEKVITYLNSLEY